MTAGSQAVDEAISALLAEPPDAPVGLTVIFGPGGIGKSFFLRKIAAGMAQRSIRDATSGIPVYAELPLLLHTDALETWLSAQGLGRLPLDAIRALIEEGVVVPVLDALDELVRGQARDGSRQFLAQLKHTVGRRARGVLSSRDYYLHLDPLVPAVLGDSAQYLTVGFFDKLGRRRYVQVRTGLPPEHASRWAGQLESQAAETLIGATEEEIEALIGHPLFLDAFCQMITDFREEERAREADKFELRSMDIFDQIVGQILEREYKDKFLKAWQKSPGPQLTGRWNDPFTPELQRRVLRELVLKVAFDGGAEASRRGDDQKASHHEDYKRLRHGLFTFSYGISEDAGNGNAVLGEIIQEVLGPPEIAPEVSETEAEAVRVDAVRTLVAAFKSHTLADTQAGQLDTLVFATRHRAYFDYILAAAVLDKLIESLHPGAGGIDEDFVLGVFTITSSSAKNGAASTEGGVRHPSLAALTSSCGTALRWAPLRRLLRAISDRPSIARYSPKSLPRMSARSGWPSCCDTGSARAVPNSWASTPRRSETAPSGSCLMSSPPYLNSDSTPACSPRSYCARST